MKSAQIRQDFLDFFKSKQHAIVPSSSLLPDSPNLLFTNAGMNQFVPIFLGQRKPTWKPARVADTQKCIRTGGKHNDLEDVGVDTYHHTFFEMLGNWSFGDYFKKEAIEWAWELVVERWKLPPQRLYATVYKPGPGDPSEFDQEAHDHWARLFQDADLDPKIHIVNGGKADNFWMMGDTGPCGPCSELHVDLTPDGDTRGALVNRNDPRCIEIWNLVFIQFNAQPVAGVADPGRVEYVPLAARHVDTGMGFERATAIIQGTKNFSDFSGIVSNYETDVFRPFFEEIEKLSNKRYQHTIPTKVFGKHLVPETAEERQDVAFRVIADHIRTLSFAIADGIIPSNEGRGYVLRRILRRAVRYGRTLDFHEPFFFKLVDVVAKTMGDVFPEVRAKQKQIKETIKREEEAFNKTLDRGIDLFEAHIKALNRDVVHVAQVLGAGTGAEVLMSGRFAFELYDTYGFPLDLTQVMARERHFRVDIDEFDRLMNEQRARARAAQKTTAIEVTEVDGKTPTNFLGYENDHTSADVQGIVDLVEKRGVVLNNSVCYAEMGGQVGDTGEIAGKDSQWKIANTQKAGATFIHVIEAKDAPAIGEHVTVKIDTPRRRAIERHHTVTHLLHWALHEIVSRDAAQKGSYVGPAKLTFDFSSAALTPQQKRDVEKLVNEKVAENAPVSWTEIPYADAKKRSDIQQFFGDKYGDTVRVVQIGGDAKSLNGYSMELCGGTHVRSTSEIGSFRIVKEEAIAAGIRRIEAVAGDAVIDWAEREAARQQEKFEMLSRKKTGLAPLPALEKDAKPAAMLDKIDMRAAQLEKLESEVHDWEKQSAKAAEGEIRSRATTIANELADSHAGKNSLVAEVPKAEGKLLQAIVDLLKPKFNGPIFLAGTSDGRVALIASVPKEMTSKLQANKLIQEIAPIVGGKGGGRPENAQGAGNDMAKLEEALAKARILLTK
jgi:alanyl-tRNA synthetase